MYRALSWFIDCPRDSSIDWNIDNAAQVLSVLSILLSQGKSIFHDNALYISNYYFISLKEIKFWQIQWQLHDLRCVLQKGCNSKTSSWHYHVNDMWISLPHVNAWHMTMSKPMKKSNLELIWNNGILISVGIWNLTWKRGGFFFLVGGALWEGNCRNKSKLIFKQNAL